MRRLRNLLGGLLLVAAIVATGSSALARNAAAPGGTGAEPSSPVLRPLATAVAADPPPAALRPLATTVVADPPPNDDFANATPISGDSGSASGTNVAATLEAGEPTQIQVGDAMPSPIGKTVWWKWTAPADGNYVFDTFGSGVQDTVLAVYSGSSLATLTLVGSGDDADGVRQSRASFDAQGGVVYYVQVGSYDGGEEDAIALNWKVNPVANDGFAHPSTITGISGSLSSSNVGATLDINEPGASATLNESVWYTWTAPADGEVVFMLTSAASRGWLSVYTGSDITSLDQLGNEFGGSLETVVITAAPGTTYRIQVGTANGVAPSSFVLQWALQALAPDPPTLTAATPGNGTVGLSWSPPAQNGGTSVTGYKVYRGLAQGGETLLTTLGNVTSFNDTTVTNGTTYWYEVAAVNAVGEGNPSNELSATPATIPGAPSLSLAGGAGSGSGVNLSWTPPTSNGGAAITAYKLYRGTSAGAETLYKTLGPVTDYQDVGASDGTTYFYKVSAVNSAGEGPRSNERSATPTAPATAPGAPTLAPATPGNSSVTLAWTPPASDGGSTITTYKIYRSTSSGGETLLDTVGTVTGYSDTTAVNGTTYFYEVSAVNPVGEGARSNERSATPSPPATVPGQPGITRAAPGTNTVTLEWITPGSGGSPITGFKIYRGTTANGETLLTTTGVVDSYTDATVASGQAYFYEVSAVNAVGEGVRSDEHPVTTLPVAPALDSAVAGDTSVALTWSAPTPSGGAPLTNYKLYRTPAGGSEALLATIDPTVTSYTDQAVVNGTTYTYTVSAVNVGGEGPKSAARSATPATVPHAPSLDSATAGNTTVTLSWSPPVTNGGAAITNYRIYRAAGTGSIALVATVGNVTSYTDVVSNRDVYDYRVTAVNAMGEGPGSVFVTAVPTAALYGAPDWWSGDCDAGAWNVKAAALGWAGAGAHRTGAMYLGIPVCGPSPASDGAPTVPWSGPGAAIPEWSSAEYAFRFMEQVYGVTPYAASAGDVVRDYTSAAGGGLQVVANGTAGSAPEPGDVISFDSASGGFVGVVAWSQVDGSGNGELRLIAQNDTTGGWRRLSVSGWVVQPFGGNTPYGWLHDPGERGGGNVLPKSGTGRPPTDPPAETVPRPDIPSFTPPTGSRVPPPPPPG
jgi:fibronectin type 3 domain-containing protein